MKEEKDKLSLSQEIASILRDSSEESSEGYTGAEWIEAVESLPKDTILAIPWCAWDLQVDEFGVTMIQSRYNHLGQRNDVDENGEVIPNWEPEPKRVARYDVLAVLIWIPMKREEPDVTLDQVKLLMNDMNIREVTRKVFAFWGVDIAPIEKQIEAAEEESQDPEAVAKRKAEEAEEAENFTE